MQLHAMLYYIGYKKIKLCVIPVDNSFITKMVSFTGVMFVFVSTTIMNKHEYINAQC